MAPLCLSAAAPAGASLPPLLQRRARRSPLRPATPAARRPPRPRPPGRARLLLHCCASRGARSRAPPSPRHAVARAVSSPSVSRRAQPAAAARAALRPAGALALKVAAVRRARYAARTPQPPRQPLPRCRHTRAFRSRVSRRPRSAAAQPLAAPPRPACAPPQGCVPAPDAAPARRSSTPVLAPCAGFALHGGIKRRCGAARGLGRCASAPRARRTRRALRHAPIRAPRRAAARLIAFPPRARRALRPRPRARSRRPRAAARCRPLTSTPICRLRCLR